LVYPHPDASKTCPHMLYPPIIFSSPQRLTLA
jgi:hypothetical protein